MLLWLLFIAFLDAPSHLYKRSCPSVGPSVGPYVPCYFRRWKRRILGASSTVYPALFLDAPSHLYMRSCPSVRRSVRRSVCPMLFSKVKSTHTRRILCRVSGLVSLNALHRFLHQRKKRCFFTFTLADSLLSTRLASVASSISVKVTLFWWAWEDQGVSPSPASPPTWRIMNFTQWKSPRYMFDRADVWQNLFCISGII